MKRRLICKGQTIATVLAEDVYFQKAEDEIGRQRRLLQSFIRRDPGFLTALDPYPVPEDAPEIVRRMAEAASRAGVGPMAAVAGAVADCALRAMTNAGATRAVVDNGGDIALASTEPVTVGIFTGPSPIKDIGLAIEPRAGTVGICTSSGTVGHSLSFGRADAALAIAPDPCLADAAATALGNAVTANDQPLIEEVLSRLLETVEGLEGLLVVIEDTLALAGRVPEIVRVPVDATRISTVRPKNR